MSSVIKRIYKKPTASITPNDERLNSFPEGQERIRMSTLSFLLTLSGHASQNN